MNRILVLIFVLAGASIEAFPIASEPDNTIDLTHFGLAIFGQPDKLTGELVKNYSLGMYKGNPEELGRYVQGDILIPRTPQLQRNGIPEKSYRWQYGMVPYTIRGTFTDKQIDVIHEAMAMFHKHTCVRFVLRSYERDYLAIGNGESGCFSSVGRIGGRQTLNLQAGCLTSIGTPMHEMMHALGFFHEQNRDDRDLYVRVLNQNVKGPMMRNFIKEKTNNFGAAYDYGSIMHYSQNAFSVNGLPTIVPVKRPRGVRIGQRDGFTPTDVQKINRMYNCYSHRQYDEEPNTNIAYDEMDEKNEC